MPPQVYQLVSNVITVDYDVYRRGNIDNWEATLDYFYKGVEQMDKEARKVLDHCIEQLRYVWKIYF